MCERVLGFVGTLYFHLARRASLCELELEGPPRWAEGASGAGSTKVASPVATRSVVRFRYWVSSIYVLCVFM